MWRLLNFFPQEISSSFSLHGDVDNHLITSGWKNDQNGREVTDLPRFRGPYLTNLAQQQHVFGTRCTWVIAKHEEWLVTYAAYGSSKINSRNGKRGAGYFDLLGNMEHDGLASPFLQYYWLFTQTTTQVSI